MFSLATVSIPSDRALLPRSSARRVTASALVCLYFLALFVGCLFLYTRHNDFPSYYHEDEPGKAWQVLQRERNFNHPQLLLEASQLVSALLHTPREVDPTVRAGRDASAVLAAAGAVAMALAAFRAYGPAGGLLGGLAVGLCPALLVYAHYMKEDAALVFGFGLAVLAGQVAWSRQQVRKRRVDVPSMLLCGLACGVAVSGKYTGLFVTLALLPFAAAWGRPSWRAAVARAALLLAAGAVTFLLINHRVLHDWHEAWQGVVRSRAQEERGLWGMRLGWPNLYHPMIFLRQCLPHVLVLAGAFAVAAVARAKRAGWEAFLLMLGAGYFVLISFASVPFNRYMLPAVVLAHLMAGVAVVGAAAWLRESGRRRAAVAVWLAGVVLIAATQFPRCLDYSAQFAGDSRERLRAWVAANLPADAVFVQDGYVGVAEPFDPRLGRSDRPSIRVYGYAWYGAGRSAVEAGPLDALRRLGVDYVAVADTEYEWFLEPTVTPAPDCREWYERHRRWYQQLFREGQLVYRDAPRHPTWSQYNNPEIRLYRLQAD